jgi:hypothetical protein
MGVGKPYSKGGFAGAERFGVVKDQYVDYVDENLVVSCFAYILHFVYLKDFLRQYGKSPLKKVQ